jgi:TonB-linked SusC/RagA family outer membrane protein
MKNFKERRKEKQGKRGRLTGFLITLVCGIQLLFAVNVYGQQQVTVSGTVTDAQGQPLPGATVVEEGTTNGTVTNADGNYTLNVPENATLVISFVGMSTQRVAVNSRTQIDIRMEEETIGLDEVVAIGYGTQKRINLTGAVAAISSEELSDKPIAQASSALQGLLPGVTVTQNLASPGNDNSTIRVRGLGTFGGKNPLVLIDGLVGAINDINPTDIESISVLKDAASSAIYGSRAANGVILITTKRASEKGLRISFKNHAGIQVPTELPEYVNAADWMQLFRMEQINSKVNPTWTQDQIDDYRSKMGTSDEYPNTDWLDEGLKNGVIHSEHLTVSGGNEQFSSLVMVSNYNNKGLIANTEFNRKTIRINSDYKPYKFLSFTTNLYLDNEKVIEPSLGVNQVFYYLVQVPATQNARLGDGKYGEGWIGENGIAHAEDGGTKNSQRNRYSIDVGLAFNPINGLELSFNYAYRNKADDFTSFRDRYNWYHANGQLGGTTPSNNGLTVRNQDQKMNYYKGIIRYSNHWSKHNFAILGGFDNQDFREDWITAFRDNFQLPKYQQLRAGDPENQTNDGGASEWALMSWIGRINYNYDERYLFEINGRYDGSSRFAEGKKWGLFPSLSAGWRISEENFMANLNLSNLKLRASWGQLGNQEIGTYPYQSTVSLTQSAVLQGGEVFGAAVTSWANTNITWETAEMMNLGLDIGLIKNKLSGTFDYFIKDTKDILLQLQVPRISGLNADYKNAASIQNKGWEFNVNWQDKIKNFEYNIGFNLSDVKNKITDLAGTGPYISGYTIRKVGEEFDAFYGYLSDGFYTPEDIEDPNVPKISSRVVAGNIKLLDLSGPDGVPDGKIDPNYDRTIIGTQFPRYEYSFSYQFKWKYFDASVFLQGVGKKSGIYDRSTRQTGYGGNFHIWEKDTWSVDNTDAAMPAYGGDNGGPSDFWIRDKSYLRVKNASIGYTLPLTIANRIYFDKIRLYIAGNNLYTFSKYFQGLDPESPDVGVLNFYPNVKTLSFGIDFTL